MRIFWWEASLFFFVSFYFISWISYRGYVKTPEDLFGMGFEIRRYLHPKREEVYLKGEQILFFMAWFVLWDIKELRKKYPEGNFFTEVFFDKEEKVIEKTPEFSLQIEKFNNWVVRISKATEGRPERHPEFEEFCPYYFVQQSIFLAKK